MLVKNDAPIKSPLSQVHDYKQNLYDLHIETLLERKISDINLLNIVNCVVFFAMESTAAICDFIDPKKKLDDYLHTNFRGLQIIGCDKLTKPGIESLMKGSGLLNPKKEFDCELENSFRRYLQPPFHPYKDGEPLKFTQKQNSLSKSQSIQQKIRGVAGAGKTLVLARRAINAYKRTRGKVLILTYNITLKNYIHDKLSKVREDFYWENFLIIHYHLFVKIMANNLGLNSIPWDDENAFESVSEKTPKFSAIFVDEVQDYKITWLHSIRKYFLVKGGEFVLLGDEKQNIYNRELEGDRRIKTNIRGRWSELHESFRLSTEIAKIAKAFQHEFLIKKYNMDELIVKSEQQVLGFQRFEYIDMSINSTDGANAVFDLYQKIIKKHIIHSNDVCIVASKVDFLKDIDYLIRTKTKERTTTIFETKEKFDELSNDILEKKELKEKIEGLRKAKKFHFWMNSGNTKLTTIHSFKGWEIHTLILILLPDQEKFSDIDESGRLSGMTDEELVYTGITRCRQNLIVVNFGNKKYHEFFSRFNLKVL